MRRRRGDDPGSVTAETALALPAVALVALVIVGVGSLGVAQLRCVDAARAGARLAARGESWARVVTRAAAIAPSGAVVTVGSVGSEAVVDVRSAVDLPLMVRVVVRSRAVADLEASLATAGGGRS
jgi:Flp pilus assembly protein TadG